MLASRVTTTLKGASSVIDELHYQPFYTAAELVCTPNGTPTGCTAVSGWNPTVYLGQVQEEDVRDSASNLLKANVTNYWSSTHQSYYNVNQLDLVADTQVLDAEGNVVGKTEYTYDDNNGSPQGVLGNQTSIKRWLDTANTSFVTSIKYNTAGMPVEIKDSNLNSTTVTYDGTGLYPQKIQSPTTGTITHIENYQYDGNTGALQSYTDQNQQVTSYSYDSAGRLWSVKAPNLGSASGATTVYCYPDAKTIKTYSAMNAGLTVPSTSTACPASSGANVQSELIDGLGRTIQIGSESADSYQNTQYNTEGQIQQVSNPHTAAGAASAIWTSFQYDVLGRTVKRVNPDSSEIDTTFDGSSTVIVDESQRKTKRIVDSLGRLTDVYEDPDGANLHTEYGYDGLANLTSVTQHGKSAETSRTRSFKYDSFSRLLWSHNPETGVICYGHGDGTESGCTADGYDANGNLLYMTDARGVRTNFFYDALNRLTRKEYTDGTPWAYFYYDQSSTWAGTPSNGIGRLTETLIGAVHQTDRVFSYDEMGRIRDIGGKLPSDQNQPGHGIHYRYDLAGNPVTIGYPSGRVVTQSFDSAGRLKSATMTGWVANATNFNSFSPTNVDFPYTYVKGDCSSSTSICYTPAGAVSSWKVGNAGQSFSYNSRLQTTRIQASGFSQNLMDRQYSFAPSTTGTCMTAGNNGNIWSIVDGLNAYHTQTFQYDCLNRLTYASRSDGAFTTNFSIDSFGNSSPSVNGTATMTFGSDNRVNSLPCAATQTAFDDAGNQLCDGLAAWGTLHQYSYDAESRVSQINSGSTSLAGYQYDTEGNRVHKDAGGDWTEYVYMNGQPLSEKHSDGSWSDYIYANGKKVAKADTFENEIQVGGDFDPHGVSWIGMTLPISIPGGTNPNTGQSYAVIRTGDRLVWQQEQFNARGGMCLFDSNGNSTSWALHALDGDLTNSWHDTSGAWLTRVVPLDSWAGHTLTGACVVVDGETNSITNGSRSIVLVNNAAILRADGSVLPIYQSGQGQPGWQIWQGVQSGNAITNNFWNIRNLQGFNTATYPSVSTTHYLADHLGSTSMALTVEGWPTQTSEFQPYGQEINPVASANHYKFTGKERDVESGLDYFGARYYSPTMGRWMSPDWSEWQDAIPFSKLDNPQSLNLYGYVWNNPLSRVDEDGHETLCTNDRWDASTNTLIAGTCYSLPDIPTVRQTIRQWVFERVTPAKPHQQMPQMPPSKQLGKVDALKFIYGGAGLIPARRMKHILDGDATGGGHRAGTGMPGKSEFPAEWSDAKIEEVIEDIATDPNAPRVTQGRDTVVTGTRDGVDVRVIIRNGEPWAAYPTNVPRNP
ncbi:RHS repeat-associated core domain-containing protein [Terriglobus albidus]|uniref:RHS repeat-associated core domain-containing protein n=1 Tax=Terriglobus albidus TaxID=1592106 RepID=UPI0021DFBF6F|nr:RHS repeat-associated core domain-containing protein [Terriglobus albidus]